MASLSKFKVKKLSHEKQKFSHFFELWLTHPQHFLTTILVGNSIVNAIFSSIATYTALDTFSLLNRELVEIGTWLSATLIIIVFGDITPKAFARRYPGKITSLSPYLLTFFLKLFTPFNSLVNSITQKFFRSILPSSSLLTREEIKILIRDILEEKAVDNDTGVMLTKTVELCELKIEQIMTPWEKVESVDIDEEPALFIDHLIERGRTRIPIYRKNKENIIGYIYVKDLLSLWQKEEKILVEKITRPVNFIFKEKKVSELLEEFKKGKIHLFVVTNADKQPLGLVTLEDVLEEVIGEILDEYDLRGRR